MAADSRPTVGPLPDIAVRVLESLHQHRLLTVRQVHAMHTADARLGFTRRILASLADHGLATRTTGAQRAGLWFITAHGEQTIRAAGSLVEPRRRVPNPAQAAGPLRAHTLAVNEVGIAFVRAAREREGDSCGALSWRHEIAHPFKDPRGRQQAHLLIADSLLSYLSVADDETIALRQRFVELDRGTIPPDQLASKLARYTRLHNYVPANDPAGKPAWRAHYRAFPAVLVVFANLTPEHARRRIQKTIALYRSDPERTAGAKPPISFATLDQLSTRGPFAPIFISIDHPERFENWLGRASTERVTR
jgi:hypothetical protein